MIYATSLTFWGVVQRYDSGAMRVYQDITDSHIIITESMLLTMAEKIGPDTYRGLEKETAEDINVVGVMPDSIVYFKNHFGARQKMHSKRFLEVFDVDASTQMKFFLAEKPCK